jgi:hypothetical protein
LFKNEAQGKTKTPELPVGNDTSQRLPATTLFYNKISFKRRNYRKNLKLKILFKNEAQGKTKTPELPVGNDKSEIAGNDVIVQKISFKRRI